MDQEHQKCGLCRLNASVIAAPQAAPLLLATSHRLHLPDCGTTCRVHRITAPVLLWPPSRLVETSSRTVLCTHIHGLRSREETLPRRVSTHACRMAADHAAYLPLVGPVCPSLLVPSSRCLSQPSARCPENHRAVPKLTPQGFEWCRLAPLSYFCSSLFFRQICASRFLYESHQLSRYLFFSLASFDDGWITPRLFLFFLFYFSYRTWPAHWAMHSQIVRCQSM